MGPLGVYAGEATSCGTGSPHNPKMFVSNKTKNRVKRIANGIDEITVAIWDESRLVVKVGILILLIITGSAIPLIPIALLARYIADAGVDKQY